MTEQQRPISLEELRKLRQPIRNVSQEHQQKLSKLERSALWITRHIGTIEFAIFCVLLVSIPLVWNSTMQVILYISSGYLQLVFLPLIMVGQNLENRYAETRAQADYELNIKSEKEIETIITHLEYQNNLINKILERLDKKQ